MGGIKILKLVVRDDISWSVTICDRDGRIQSRIEGDPVDLQPIGSRTLRRRTIDFLVKLLIESRDAADTDEARVGELLGLLGEQMYEMLFMGPLRARLNQDLQALVNGDLDLLRIELEFGRAGEAATWLAALPWEYLRCPHDAFGGGQFLAMLANRLVLSRVLTLTGEARALEVKQPWTVLVVHASPSSPETPPVSSERVRELISIHEQKHRVKVEPKLIRPSAGPYLDSNPSRMTFSRFGDLVEQTQPHIIHFVGHGRLEDVGGQLAFEDKDGRPQWVDGGEFASTAARSSKLKLVFLQACESALPYPHLAVSGVAQQIADRTIPAVVAMQYRVEPEIVNTFAEGFYEALVRGEPVDLAVKEGRERMREASAAAQRLGFGLPVLYLNSYLGMLPPQSPAAILPSSLEQRAIDKGTPGVRCARCRYELKPADNYCGRCQARLSCPECGQRLRDTLAPGCSNCGAPINQPPYSAPRRSVFGAGKGGRPSVIGGEMAR